MSENTTTPIHTTETIKKEQLKVALFKEKKIDLKMCYPAASQFVDIVKLLSEIYNLEFGVEDSFSDDITFFLCGEEYFLDWKHLSPEEVSDVSAILYYYIGCKLEYGKKLLGNLTEPVWTLSVSIDDDFEKKRSSDPPTSNLKPITICLW